MRRGLLVLLVLIAGLGAASAARAVVVTDGSGGTFGVALVPGTDRSAGGISSVTSPPPCQDPWLASDLGGPILDTSGLCYHGGAVLHRNEVFDLTWDPLRRDWSTTRDYVEHYLRAVADSSGTLGTPYALTQQYQDAGGRALNQSTYAGGCIDYGSRGGAACQLGDSSGTAPGDDYPPSDPSTGGCTARGFDQFANGGTSNSGNDVCLTDAQIQHELSTMISQQGLAGRTQSGYQPLIVVMTPHGVVDCLDGRANSLCSANSAVVPGNHEFCAYHSSLTVNGTRIPYVVLPWVALTGCDEPDASQIQENPPVDELADAVGARLVSPLSQSTMATITNPFLDGWSALDGSEINDNGGCAGHSLDNITLDGATYLLQREFNNGGVIVDDPNAPRCAPLVNLQAEFVAPSEVDAGDVVEFDGSKTVSTLVVPRAGYRWDFGDGTSATGPSVVHTFTENGTYTVALTVTDRGGYTSRLSQTVQVGPPGTPTTTSGSQATLKARLQLMPQSLRSVLRSGLAVQITSNLKADGITTLSLPKSYAKQAHLHVSRSASVVIGRGTVAGVKAGTMTIHVKIPSATVRRLQKLRRLALTISVNLRGPSSTRETLDAAGRY